MSSQYDYADGPFVASHIREGDPYELSNGHPIDCAPASGPAHGSSNLIVGEVLDTDPDVEWVGVDVGYSPEEGTLRAADLAVDHPPPGDGTGWVQGVPRLAIEQAGSGQDEKKLQEKISDFFRHGTEFVWVVRLLGPRRVEVYTPDGNVETKTASDELTAPGIVRNPVPVQAFFDRKNAHPAALRNLLQREGYEDLNAVREEGREEGEAQGLAEGLLLVLEARQIAVDNSQRERIRACRDLDQLRRWASAVATVSDATGLLS